jgi:osmoprotectant transport system substrate-binding protein
MATVLLVIFLAACGPSRQDRVVVGCKNFTEQLVLGEIIAQQIENRTHLPVERRFYLAGTYICQQSMLSGRIDIYPEYTGTALGAILKQKPQGDSDHILQLVRAEYGRQFGFHVGEPFGFNDTFAIEIRGEEARRLGLKTISQAAPYASRWRAGFGYEFMERPDGYQGLVATYGLHFADSPRVMDLGLLDRALKDHQVDLIAGNNTDGLVPVLDLFVLNDDKRYFPPYDAVPVVRQEALRRHSGLQPALDALAGKISEDDMRRLNFAVDGQHRDVTEVVRQFLASKGLP